MSSLLRGSKAARSKASKLLRGGTVLIHDEQDHISPLLADILIEGDRISKIEVSITAPTGCRIIDCTDNIISPGFVDTHHHVWQSPLKGFFGDTALFPYLAIGSYTFLSKPKRPITYKLKLSPPEWNSKQKICFGRTWQVV